MWGGSVVVGVLLIISYYALNSTAKDLKLVLLTDVYLLHI
jgi:hypothetical protein